MPRLLLAIWVAYLAQTQGEWRRGSAMMPEWLPGVLVAVGLNVLSHLVFVGRAIQRIDDVVRRIQAIESGASVLEERARVIELEAVSAKAKAEASIMFAAQLAAARAEGVVEGKATR